ncbi:MAG: flagellar hook-basal body complex protein [Firmicutes bacterium]|nr:flagellar hook-basal body complex protein [Bacillota bacterium]
MMGAMYVGISGMKAHMNMMNVIGNNTANVNTYGYKSQRMLFRESIYTTTAAGSDGTTVKGGTNPSQLGFGVQVGTIDLNMSASTYTPTGRGWDCMIDGDGFFLLGDKDQEIGSQADLSSLTLSRLGDFKTDSNGYVTDGAGNVLFGYATVQNPDYHPFATEKQLEENPTWRDAYITSTELVPLRLPLMAAIPSADNNGLRADGTKVWEAGAAVYPVLSEYTVATGQVNMHLDNPVEAEGDGTAANPGITQKDLAAMEALMGNNPTDAQREGMFLGNMATLMPIDSEKKCVSLNTLTISKDGRISGINDATGETVVVGYIAIATVDNPFGVTHVDGPYYKAMDGSGELRVGSAGNVLDEKFLNNKKAEDSTAANKLQKCSQVRNSGLEASGANVADEFANLITTERGYQANCRIITVSDEMLEELVNIKR